MLYCYNRYGSLILQVKYILAEKIQEKTSDPVEEWVQGHLISVSLIYVNNYKHHNHVVLYSQSTPLKTV